MQDEERTLGSDRTLGRPGDAPTWIPDEETPTLAPGSVLAGRYQIIDLLGAGGMGAVYRAFDRQLTRLVALKTILPELAATPTALKRFKQEVLLAQSIVHKNVVRIFDIGEDGPTKFITMDFVDGRDLKTVILERGKLPAQEAVAIIREVCAGLEAAHAAGVVHRDLKPQNIMINKDGHVVVMDFGIAHSGQSRGVTQTGAFLGTPEYMSPEQAKTEDVDARSDIFSLGLIFYEMLTGKLPFHGSTMLETMFKRTTERAIPPAEIERTVPQGANQIVVKCLQIERDRRYQNIAELLQDLEHFDPAKKVGTADRAKFRLKKLSSYWKWVAAAAALVVAALIGFGLRNRSVQPPAAAHAPETIIIADFINHTGDPVFDGTLEPVVKIALEGASFIAAYDRTQMRALGVAPVSGRFDEVAARKIAVSQGAGVVIAGSLDREGDSYTLSVRATRAVTGDTIKAAQETASKRDQVVFTATKLASQVRNALGDDASETAQRFAMETLTAASLESIREYAAGMENLSNGKYNQALSSFSKAIDVDPNFGLAYSGMAVAYRNMYQVQDSEKYIRLALQHIDRMTDREKYRTRGFYDALIGDQQKCIDEYSSLINRFPADAAAHNNLAICATQLRNMPKAIEEVRQAAAILPKRVLYRNNLSLYASYGSEFEAAEQDARTVQELDPTYTTGFIALAFAQLGQGRPTDAAETYGKVGKIGKLGASKAASGLGDIALYQGRFNDAVRILQEGANADISDHAPDRAAAKLVQLAYARLLQGNKQAAAAAAESALMNSTSFQIRFLAGRVFAQAGQTRRASELIASLGMELQLEPQAYAKILDGDVKLEAGKASEAVQSFSEANRMVDVWIGHFDLGRAYLAAGLQAFPQADSEFELCLKRRGEALALFLDEEPTYGYFPSVYYYLGRVREGLKTQGYADFYRTYASIRGTEDPLAADARKRAGL